MDIREALYTTRAMRRVKPDPVPDDVQARIIDAAIRAPSGGNTQGWRFVMVDDKGQIAKIGELMAESIDMLFSTIYKEQAEYAQTSDDPEAKQFKAIMNSVHWARDNFAEYPLLLFAFDQFDTSGGSIFPAVWNAMLQARADGVGSSLTSVLLFKGEEPLDVLGVPKEEGWRMACCVPMGYPLGKWGVAKRNPAHEVAYRNTWGNPIDPIPEPLWP
ncbi:MAG: nitroreductase family protein [Acidimicrobiales bacterium]|jgi:nitroreductase|nr:nitroreductase family protein [Acidimicrobiales bacterium]